MPRPARNRVASEVQPVALADGSFGVPLSCGDLAIVDADDLDTVMAHCWFKGPSGHARTKSARANTYMHRMILGHVDGEVDHINRNPLDNRRCNLRTATRSQNVANRATKSTSGFRGVRLRSGGKFEASIKTQGRKRSLGYFDCAEDAARAYDKAAAEIFGEFATLNFPANHEIPAEAGGGASLCVRVSHAPFLHIGGCEVL